MFCLIYHQLIVEIEAKWMGNETKQIIFIKSGQNFLLKVVLNAKHLFKSDEF